MSNPITQDFKVQFYHSLNFDSLVDTWIDNYQKRILHQSPLLSETVVVHSHAMAQHLNKILTQKIGVTALINYLLPTAFENQVRNFLLHNNNLPIGKRTYSGDNPFDPNCLRWIIYSLITSHEYKKSIRNLPVMGNYLFNKKKSGEEELSHLKAFQLAHTMANLFNGYLFFREDMLWEWDSNLIEEYPDKIQWQKWLWQTIRQHIDHPHRLEELEKIKKILKNNSFKNIRKQNTSSLIFPDHISVFGISFLPNYYLELFNNLKKIITIDYYYPDSSRPLLIPNPATGNSIPHVDRPLFIEKVSELTIAYQESIEKLHWNSISLPSYKKQLQTHDTQASNSWGILNYIKSFCTTSLNISHLAEKNISSNTLLNQSPFADFQVHKCCNRRREVEIVKTQILVLLEREAHLTLDQILILAPDILDYQDYIESVFTCEPSIPYHIIDRNENHNNSVIKAILTLLDLFNSEWELSKVKEIFSLNLIKSSWKWEEVDILFFEEWINRIGVKRGRGQESISQHFDLKKYSWRKGIHRIMFSYALLAPNNEKIYFDETQVTGKLHGDEAQNLGEMVYLLQKLLDYDSKFQTSTNFLTWLERIQNLTHEIIYFNKQEYLYHFQEQKDHSRFIDQIKKIGEEIAFASKSLESLKNKNLNESETAQPIDLYTFTKILQQNLNETEHVTTGTHYGVTCGSLLPLRIIPSEITFMLGMGRDDFPRHDRNAHINIVLQNPRPSDRTKKKGDQLLFIETIFSTKRYLGITYSPPPESGAEEASPSIIVDELLLFLNSQSKIKTLRESIIQEHPLLPFPISPLLSTNTKTTKPKQLTISEKDKPPPSYYRYSFDPEDHRNALALYQQTHNPTTLSANSIFNKTITVLKTVNLVLQHFSHTKHTFSSTPLKQDPSYEFLSHLNQIWTQGIKSLKLLTNPATSNHLKKDSSSQEIVVKLYELIFFFNNAPRFFFKKILKINLEVDEADVNNQEPLTLNSLQKYQIISEKIQEHLSQLVLKADTPKKNFLSSTSTKKDPLFPAGEPGNNQVDLINLSLEQINKNINSIKNLITEALGNPPNATTTINIDKTLTLPQKWGPQTLTSSYKFANKKINFKLEGYIKDVFLVKNNRDTENPIIRHNLLCRYLKITSQDIIKAWFEHLFLHLDAQSPAVTWLIGEEEFFFFAPLSPSSLKEPTEKKNKPNNKNSLHGFLNSLISCYLIGHALPLPIYRNILDHFHEIQFKKIIPINKKETINALSKLTLPTFSLGDQKEENKVTFKDSNLHPLIEKNPYAHYLWGENNYNSESLSSETVAQFSEFYHFLFYSAYQHLRKVDL